MQKCSILVMLCFLSTLAPLWAADVQPAANVAASANEIDPVMTGDTIPATTVRTVQGDELALADVVAAKPTVLIFYRGGW